MSKVHQRIAVAASHHGRRIQALPIHITCCKAARTRPHSEVARLLVESGLGGHPLMHSFRATSGAFVCRLVHGFSKAGLSFTCPSCRFSLRLAPNCSQGYPYVIVAVHMTESTRYRYHFFSRFRIFLIGQYCNTTEASQQYISK